MAIFSVFAFTKKTYVNENPSQTSEKSSAKTKIVRNVDIVLGERERERQRGFTCSTMQT